MPAPSPIAIKCTLIDNKAADINDKNCSLFTVLTATHQKNCKNHEKVILLSITLTYRRRDSG